MSNSSAKYISVFIPTFNGEKYLSSCLSAVLGQTLPAGHTLEVLVTDSGSTDGTIDILKSFGDKITLEQIPNAEFGHGRTRQAAAKKARGEFILFLSQDAIPLNERWLINMIEPFMLSPKVGCVYGRQVPRTFAVPTIKREVAATFGALGVPDAITVHRHGSLVDGFKPDTLNTFFSDANSAVRRELLMNKVPFRDVEYAEDQALAEDMQKHGYLKAYTPLGAVWHSNDYTIKEYFWRKFDEYNGLQDSVATRLKPSLKSLLLGWIRPTIADYKFLIRDREYAKRSRFKGILVTPFYNMALQAGKYYSAKYARDPKNKKKYSLEAKMRQN